MKSRLDTPVQMLPIVSKWMSPVSDTLPCGQDLEYDPEFVLLCARVEPRLEAQYGEFVGMPEPVSWSEIDRDCSRLMERSRDIRLAVLFARGRTHLAGLMGFAESLCVLAGWLKLFPTDIHPRVDADTDPSLSREIRRNSLEALVDPDGLLGDLRQVDLMESAAARVQVRDIEFAFTQPDAGDGPSIETVRQYLDELPPRRPQFVSAIRQATTALTAIEAWADVQLGADGPNLLPLVRILNWLDGICTSGENMAQQEPDRGAMADGRADAYTPGNRDQAQTRIRSRGDDAMQLSDRDAAGRQIEEVRAWFAHHEPGSPVVLLLRYAQQCIGKSYVELIDLIPPELLLRLTEKSDLSLS
ncbi:ImpA family type VI secretion system protein [Paraburkholderia caffeinilytica]|uniref:type VI secretion system protein TssA n=1 Tax=Paraburkholderia caffeinilytica TaxID=1761016 RepID=UPI003DA0BC73